jgi:hypothetical protein
MTICMSTPIASIGKPNRHISQLRAAICFLLAVQTLGTSEPRTFPWPRRDSTVRINQLATATTFSRSALSIRSRNCSLVSTQPRHRDTF